MYLPTFLILGLSATVSALPPTSRRACTSYRTVSDPGFYASASLPSADFPDDPPYFENQILEFQPSFTSTSTCTLFGNFERGFPVRVDGNAAPKLNVYQRHSSTDKKLVGTFAALELDEQGETTDIVSSPIATFKCQEGTVFEFEVALSGAGSWASVAFEEDAESGFSVLAC
ncbi:hypothetical protein DPSP01_008796 [Paraphaeosphaeria sporulosa]|uniref:Ubiquitin 3 binding protein But2 C-terminal domain-containing protein n=1 Tax=Paraphaeosphaeria sporulosa TaxID=1460663 RepID=A0A177CAM4_9PLEO|nr:uncharacterized protein CC84DRAFT_791898 [Paraphaeosphaeria sporulosa]OAG04426.1 hypothetical protein CC84DRAFT_791898 [Paraphaeosphaeria sporulosa]